MTTGFPHGSVLGPLLYTANVTPVGRLIASYGVHYHEYADDTQLFTKMSVPATAAIGLLQDCVKALQYWFWNNGLLLNGRLRQSMLSQIIAEGYTINVPDTLCLLGVMLDNTLSFDQQANNIVKNCNYHLQALRHIRASVTDEVAKMMACSIIGSRIDYCISLFYGMTDRNLNKLQRVQN